MNRRTRRTTNAKPAERPEWLGLPGEARHVTRTQQGFLAAVSDMFGNRRKIGVFPDAAAALAAARAAFDAAEAA